MHKLLNALKNRHFIALTLCFAVFISLFALIAYTRSEKISVFSSGEDSPVLVIDAGHGGIDGGAIGVDGSRESDINLAIALKAEAVSLFLGVESVMTRVDDSRGSDALSYSEHRELVYRTELANRYDKAVFLSIHQNCYPTAQPGGPQVIYADNDESKRFGKLTHDNIIKSLAPECRRLAEPDKGNIYVLNNVDCPAILVECGFVSNHGDITKLTDGKYQTALAAVLLASYIQYISDNTLL